MKNSNPRSNLFALFFKSLGTTITDIDDVIFRLAYFERKHHFSLWTNVLLDWILKSLTFDTEQLKAINFIFLGFEPCRSDFGLFGLFDLMTEGHEAFENL